MTTATRTGFGPRAPRRRGSSSPHRRQRHAPRRARPRAPLARPIRPSSCLVRRRSEARAPTIIDTSASWFAAVGAASPTRPALAEHDGAVGDLRDVLEVVRDQEHGDAALGQPRGRGRAPWPTRAGRAPPSARRGSPGGCANATARSTAIAWRWPPDISADLLPRRRRDRRRAARAARASRRSIARSRSSAEPAEPARAAQLAPDAEVRDRARGCRTAPRSWCRVSIPALARLRGRARTRPRRPSRRMLARVERVHAADRLDQRRLARAVVAEQRDDLARARR